MNPLFSVQRSEVNRNIFYLRLREDEDDPEPTVYAFTRTALASIAAQIEEALEAT